MASNIDRGTISGLAQIVYKEETSLVSGSTKLSLTTSSLTALNAGFERLADVECVQDSRIEIANNRALVELQFLKEVLEKIPSLKIIHGTSTIQGRADISCFGALRHLEVKKVPIHLLEGLRTVRAHLLSLTCNRCLQALQDIFVNCGGDMSGAHAWSALRAVNLSANQLEQLDDSLRYLPVLEYLDLSYNHLTSTAQYLTLLPDLLHVNLGYNKLQSVPNFSATVLPKLNTLILRNNNLDNIQGVESLSGLTELDLSDNCLAEHSQLNAISFLHAITTLNLNGNPLYYHVNHRVLALQYLSPLAISKQGKVQKVWLDGKLVGELDRTYVPRDPVYFLAPPPGSHQPVPSTSTADNWTFDAMHHKVQVQIHHQDMSRDHSSRDRASRAADMADNASFDATDSDTGSRSNRKSKKRARKVVIMEQNTSNDVDDSSREPSRAPSPKLCTSLVVEADRAEYEAARKQLGPDWLVTVNEKYYSANQTQQNDNMYTTGRDKPVLDPAMIEAVINSNFPVGPRDFIGGQMADPEITSASNDVTTQQATSTSSSGVVPLVTRSISEDVRIEWNWSGEHIEDEVADGEPFIVTREDGTQMMAVLGAESLWETNLNNQVCDKLELSTLRDVVLLPQTTDRPENHVDTSDTHVNRVHLLFDTLRSDRKQRLYIMEDDQHALQFVQTLQKHLEQKLSSEAQSMDMMHCMKCDVKYDDSQRRLSDGVSSCPHCGGTIVIQVDTADTSDLPGDSDVGSLRSVDCLMPLAASSANTSPEKRRQEGSPGLTELTVGSLPNTAIFHIGPDSSPLRRNQSYSDVGDVSGQLNTSWRNPIVSEKSPALVNGFTAVNDGGATGTGSTPVPSQNIDISNSSPPLPSVVISDPGLTKSSYSQINGGQALNSQVNAPHPGPDRGRRRIDSDESDITVISNPSISSIIVLPNPSREMRLSSRMLGTDVSLLSGRVARSVSMDEGRTYMTEYMDTLPDEVHDEVITETLELPVVSPCGSLTTKTVSSMVDSIYERHLSDQTTSDTDSFDEVCERGERSESILTDRTCKLVVDTAVTASSPDTKSRVLTTSRGIVYNYDDYRQVDHRLKLWMAMSVFENSEELQLLLKCDLCCYGNADLHPGLLIVSNSNLHIYKITGPESGEPVSWLAAMARYPKTSIRYLDIGYQYQWFQLEFTDSLYTFVVRDENRCKLFIAECTAVIEGDSLSNRSQLLGITKNQQTTMENLSELCIQNDGHDSDDKLLFAGYAVRGKGDSIPVSVLITPSSVYLCSQSFQWPPPRAAAHTQSGSKLPAQFTLINKRLINEISCLNLYDDLPLTTVVSFFSEDVTSTQQSDWSASWMVTMETEQTLSAFISAIRSPWEAEFGVELQTLNHSVSPSGPVT